MKLIIVRHGESEGNVDKSVYQDKFDYDIELTAKGKKQALEAGEHIAQITSDDHRLYVSPYKRAVQTLLGIKKKFKTKEKINIDPRLREQEYKMFKNSEEREEIFAYHQRKGPFWYRFKHGESGADVYQRVLGFLETLEVRSKLDKETSDVVIVCHEIVAKCFLMKLLGLTVDQFHNIPGIDNAEPLVFDVTNFYNYKLNLNQSKRNKGLKEFLKGLK